MVVEPARVATEELEGTPPLRSGPDRTGFLVPSEWIAGHAGDPGYGCSEARLQSDHPRSSGAISPFNAFLVLQGIETLSLRMQRHCRNAEVIASFLSRHPQVTRVNYSGLLNSPSHVLATDLAGGRGYGSVPSFVIDGGRDAGRRFVEALTLHSHVANIGDVRSLVIHPASTTHSQLTAVEQESSGVEPGLVRLSVGLEDVDDLVEDLEAGFAAAR